MITVKYDTHSLLLQVDGVPPERFRFMLITSNVEVVRSEFEYGIRYRINGSEDLEAIYIGNGSAFVAPRIFKKLLDNLKETFKKIHEPFEITISPTRATLVNKGKIRNVYNL